MKKHCLCCLKRAGSKDSLPVQPHDGVTPRSAYEHLRLDELPPMNHEISLATSSLNTTHSGNSEAAREIRRIFEENRQGVIQESQSKVSTDSPQTTRDGKKPLLRKTSSMLSSAIRRRMSRDSAMSRSNLRRPAGNVRSESSIERQKELQKALKERLERELRDGGRASQGGYDSDAEMLSTVGSSIGYATFRARQIPYTSYTVLAQDTASPGECESVDIGLAHRYRSILAQAVDDPDTDTEMPAATTESATEQSSGNAKSIEHTKLQSASDSALILSASKLYRVGSPDTLGESDNELYRERLRLLSRDSNNLLKTDECAAGVNTSKLAHGTPRPICDSDEVEARLNLSQARRPRDSGISLRDLDPSEYSDSSGSGNELMFPSWLKRAGSLINPSRYVSTQSDPVPRIKVRREPGIEEMDFGGLDGYPGSSVPTPSQAAKYEDWTNSPSSDLTRAVQDITIPARLSRRSISEAVLTANAEQPEHRADRTGKSERRLSLNSFRRRFFSQNSPTSSGNVQTVLEPPGEPQQVSSRRERIIKQKSEPAQTRKRTYEASCFQGSTDSFVAQELVAAKRIVPRTRSSTLPRTSKFREELDNDDYTPTHKTRVGRHNSLSKFKPRAKPNLGQNFDGSSGQEVQFKTPNFGPRSTFVSNDSADEAWGRALELHKIDLAAGYLEPTGFNRGRRSISPARLSVSRARAGVSPGASSGVSPAGSEHSAMRNHTWRPSFSRDSQLVGLSTMAAKSGKSTSIAGPAAQRRPTRVSHLVPQRRPDGTWARYPSHIRAQRNGPASASDGVISRDFATDLVVDAPARNEGNAAPQKLSLKQRMKRDLIRLFENNTYGHRSSVSAGYEVEYPELEILPNLEMPFFLPEDDDDDDDDPSSPEQRNQTWSYQRGFPADSRIPTPFLEVNTFNTPSIRRISTHIAPDVIIERPETTASDSLSQHIETGAGMSATPSPIRLNDLLHPFDAMRSSPNPESLGTSRSSSAQDSKKRAEDTQGPVGVSEFRLDVTDYDEAAKAKETDGCLERVPGRQD